jgi:hypothetical protein
MGLTAAAFRPRLKGPPGGEIVTASFSLVTTTLTAGECMGCTVARTGVGTYVVTLGRVYKAINIAWSIQAATTAQDFRITARDLAAKTITIKQMTAGTGTAVDTLTAQVDLIIVGRTVIG